MRYAGTTVLFVDIDGVLHPDPHDGSPLVARPLLWDILRACPETVVVVSSTWREHRTLEALRQQLTAGGGDDLATRIIDTSPILPPEPQGDYRHRARECLAWLAKNEGNWPAVERPVRWLALDDMPYWWGFDCAQLYRCDYRSGLTPADVPRIIARLRS